LHSFSAKQDTGGDVLDISDENTNKFSTTWSFQTSEDPWTAGASSDVSNHFIFLSHLPVTQVLINFLL